jgi:hypothetical protein
MSKAIFIKTDAEFDRKLAQVPGQMFHFEAVKNSIEAYQYSKKPVPKHKKIIVRPMNPDLFGYEFSAHFDNETLSEKKWSIFNHGDGMSAEKLSKVLNGASSGDEKIQSAKDNHGEGVLIAGVKNNPLGVVFVSCCDGKVSLAWVQRGQSNTGYSVVNRHDFFNSIAESNTKFTDILDVTDAMNWEQLKKKYPQQFDPKYDWTVVIALGTNPNQNTCERPYSTDHKAVANWFARDVYNRMYRKPSDIDIIIENGAGLSRGGQTVQKSDGPQRQNNTFTTYEQDIIKNTTGKKAKESGVLFEKITDADTDLKISYIYEPPIKYKNNNTGALNPWHISYSGIVHNNMAYSTRSTSVMLPYHHLWREIAPACGVTVQQDRFRIIVELNTSNITPINWRQDIAFDTGEMQRIDFKTFLPSGQRICDVVRHNMPKWYKDKMKELDTASTNMSDLTEFFQKHLENISANRPVMTGSTTVGGAGKTFKPAYAVPIDTFWPPAQPQSYSSKKSTPIRNTNTGKLPSALVFPKIVWCHDIEEWKSKGGEYSNIIESKSAWFDTDNNQVWLNAGYDILPVQVTAITDKVQCEASTYIDEVVELVRTAFAKRIGFYIAGALNKSSVQGGWDAHVISQSHAPMALTVAGEHFWNKDEVIKQAKELKTKLDNKVH